MPADWTFVSVDMELTNRCGSGCLMCPRDSITRPKGMMSEDVFKTVSDNQTERHDVSRCIQGSFR